MSVRLPCSLCIVSLWLNKNEWIGSDPLRTRFTAPYTDPITLNSSPREPLTLVPWCHLANKLTSHCEQTNRQNFHVWNSHRQHAARLYSWQLRTIGCFSATAGLLVMYCIYVKSCYRVSYRCLSLHTACRWSSCLVDLHNYYIALLIVSYSSCRVRPTDVYIVVYRNPIHFRRQIRQRTLFFRLGANWFTWKRWNVLFRRSLSVPH